ncbi:MAG: hypothetical protein CVV14_07445 [Gammaproteobacteria bacterium HGW-Gammaproteobacteria-4]|nr:MAG: hypothetical protein CVV14_07445 [Gammaproteobacteria bacterium HGW-Gammaproteobacteria-4]
MLAEAFMVKRQPCEGRDDMVITEYPQIKRQDWPEQIGLRGDCEPSRNGNNGNADDEAGIEDGPT